MKGNPTIIQALNNRLSEELGAISQYMVHAEMVANWGYGKLHDELEQTAHTEMHHAETLIARIIFLEGQPIVHKLPPIKIGGDVQEIIINDHAGEAEAVGAYNKAIGQAAELGDNGTRELLEGILRDEEAHVDWGETQSDQIKQMGLPQYLNSKV
jgi:bacterioferritin